MRREILAAPNRWSDGISLDQWRCALERMRVLRTESEGYLAAARRLVPPFGAIAVGAGEFDEFIRGESLAVFLGALADGYLPSLARVAAVLFMRDAVSIHNRKRPRDANWRRDGDCCLALIDRAYELMLGVGA